MVEGVARRVLILGAGGNIGKGFCEKYREIFYIGTSKRDLKPDFHYTGSIEDLRKFCIETRVTCVLILIGLSDPLLCEKNTILSLELNYHVPIKIAQMLSEIGVYSITCSTEYVYTNSEIPLGEEESLAICTYGSHKLRLEESMTSLFGSSLRLPKVYWKEAHLPGILSRAARDLKTLQSFPVASDQIFSPLLGDDLVKVVLALSHKKPKGVFNCCQDKCISRIEIYRELASNVPSLRPFKNSFYSTRFKDIFPAGAVNLPNITCMSNRKIKSLLGLSFTDIKLVIKSMGI